MSATSCSLAQYVNHQPLALHLCRNTNYPLFINLCNWSVFILKIISNLHAMHLLSTFLSLMKSEPKVRRQNCRKLIALSEIDKWNWNGENNLFFFLSYLTSTVVVLWKSMEFNPIRTTISANKHKFDSTTAEYRDKQNIKPSTKSVVSKKESKKFHFLYLVIWFSIDSKKEKRVMQWLIKNKNNSQE